MTSWRDKTPVQLAEEQAALQQTEEDIAELRALTMEQRAWMVESVCLTAASALKARAEMGMTWPMARPWPDSTRALLRKYAANGNA